VDYCGSSSLLVRSEIWTPIGGLDERSIRCNYVDTDLADVSPPTRTSRALPTRRRGSEPLQREHEPALEGVRLGAQSPPIHREWGRCSISTTGGRLGHAGRDPPGDSPRHLVCRDNRLRARPQVGRSPPSGQHRRRTRSTCTRNEGCSIRTCSPRGVHQRGRTPVGDGRFQGP